MQTIRMFATSRKNGCKWHHAIAEIGRAYLHNIADHYGKPYGLKTWQQIGNKPVPASIYAKQV